MKHRIAALIAVVLIGIALLCSGCFIEIVDDKDNSKDSGKDQQTSDYNRSATNNDDGKSIESDDGDKPDSDILDISYYFPRPGESCTYEITDNEGRISREIRTYTLDGNSVVLDCESRLGEVSTGTYRDKYNITDQGVTYFTRCTVNNGREFLIEKIDGGTYLQFPYFKINEGKEYSYSVSSEEGGGQGGTMEVNFTGREMIEIMGQRIDAAVITIDDACQYDETDHVWEYQGKKKMWYARDWGLVKFETTTFYRGKESSSRSGLMIEATHS